MTENAERPRWIRPLLVSVTTIAAAAAVVFGITQWVGGDDGGETTVLSPSGGTPTADDGTGTPAPGGESADDDLAGDKPAAGSDQPDEETTPVEQSVQVLPEPLGGQAAIDALGDKIERVAQLNGRTVEDLKELLLRDSTAKVTPTGFIAYHDTFGKTPAPTGDEG